MSHLRLVLLGLLCSLLGLLLPARAAEPTTQPLLQFDIGMHSAPISRIATDAGGRWAVTASTDKTARIWDVASGRLLGVLRPPQDAGDEGKLYAVDISPDGSQIAVGGWTGWDWDRQGTVYLFDRASLRLTGRLGGLPQRVTHLAYAPDGRRLAVSLKGRGGVLVFDTASGQVLGGDSTYGDDSYSVQFSPDGQRLLSSSDDGQLRLHAVESGGLRLLQMLRPGGGRHPVAARYSPDGRRVAVGFDDSNVLQILDADDLHELTRLDSSGIEAGSLSSVAWSADGRSLAAAGRWPDAQGRQQLRRWSASDGTRLADVPLAASRTVMQLAALPITRGGWLYASADPGWGRIGSDGRHLLQFDAGLADLRDQGEAFQLSADGTQLQFGARQGGRELRRIDLSARDARPAEGPAVKPTPLLPPRLQAPTLQVLNWKNREDPSLNGRPLLLEPHEISRSLALGADARQFALGSDWNLRLYDASGQLLWSRPAPGVVWALNLSQNGRWVVAAYGDGTIRWHRRSDGQPVLAWLALADAQRWVRWTPEGFYDAAPDAGQLVGYHSNRGRDREGVYTGAAQLRDRYFNPALLTRRLLPGGDELLGAAVKQLGRVDELLASAANVPPEIEVDAPEIRDGDSEVTVSFRVRDNGGGIGQLKFYVDGQPVEARQSGVVGGQTMTRTFALAPGQRSIQIAATSRGGVDGPTSKPIQVVLKGNRPEPNLHILAIGVENYRDPNLRLRYSVSDAEQIANQLASRAQPLFARVLPPRLLKNEQASLAGIEQAFQDLKTQIRPDDTLVIFLAGHGEARVGTYTFLPWDFQRGASGPGGEGLNEARLFRMLDQSPARTLLLIDSCDAGGIVEL
ncbi:MAG: hypothetical protein RJA44_1016, partial [Pseudomonadota bacterium]